MSRRPDLLGVRRLGTVRWFNDERGYCRITAEAGDVLWFHHSEIQIDGYRVPSAGQRVSFVWDGHTTAHGRHAAELVRPEVPIAARLSPRRRRHRDPSTVASTVRDAKTGCAAEPTDAV